MPPKQTSGRGKSEESKDEPLQAVVLADTFETKFAPFITERPRCLIPLANVPLIEYTLQYLASAGVRELFFYAGAHIEQVENYLNASKWVSASSPFQNVTFLRCMATSVGDIMRDLDQKQLINRDFICVSGDIVSNFPLQKALKVHKQRREKDKNAIMTMLLRERSESDHRYRGQVIPTFLIDPVKDRCLHYEESTADTQFGVHVDPEMLKTAELDIRQDLVDCYIDICTPDMLSLWSDNFDNQKPRKDFLFGVLKDYELNGKTIHTYIIEGYYANRVQDPTAYASISNDLQHGVARSLMLTNNTSDTRLKRLRNDIAKEEDVIIQRPVRLDQGTIIGQGTSIGSGCSIRKSVLGRNCQIGKKNEINTSYVWDYVTIGSNVKMTRCIVGSETYIGDNCVIEEGALVAYGAKIPANSHVRAGTRVTKTSTFAMANGDRNGERSHNYDDDEDDNDADYDPLWAQSLYSRKELTASVSSLESDASDVSAPTSREGSRSQSFATQASDEDGTDRFQHDTAAILVQRMQEGRHVDDMQSELMGLRFSGGADGSQVQNAVAIALVRYISSEVGSGLTPEKATRNALERYHHLIRRPNAEQTTEEQIYFLLEAQTELVRKKDGERIIPFMVKDLYDLEVFEEESFTAWFDDERSRKPEVVAIRDAAKPFIDWLATADEEDSDEEDDSD